ncbi:hypothetical protein [Pseudonocardia acidicola]|uniref:Uncharacterized protein n=1 Tax=Pseudonocardia acidicola TaxID=2724939 RepID=A0ABX1S4C6_9PSEU|nr:hypothetical protein [Pseudonocardia acidicola]NMH95759.1 hypothetical protein [Pseudonocardia acidicola]
MDAESAGCGGPTGIVRPSGEVSRATRGIRDDARAQVLVRHARLMSSGRPTVCKPSRAEIEGRMPSPGRGSDGKVIYPDRESAEAAARELELLGARALRAYLCRRSRHGHFHLTTDAVAERSRASLAMRIPRQRDARSA